MAPNCSYTISYGSTHSTFMSGLHWQYITGLDWYLRHLEGACSDLQPHPTKLFQTYREFGQEVVYLKIHWTKYRLACTCLGAFSMPIPIYTYHLKQLIFLNKFCIKKETIVCKQPPHTCRRKCYGHQHTWLNMTHSKTH